MRLYSALFDLLSTLAGPYACGPAILRTCCQFPFYPDSHVGLRLAPQRLLYQTDPTLTIDHTQGD
jgi:hypothetical protein